MVTSSRPGDLRTPRRAASPTAALQLTQGILAEHTWSPEKPGRTRPEGAGRVRRSKTSGGNATWSFIARVGVEALVRGQPPRVLAEREGGSLAGG